MNVIANLEVKNGKVVPVSNGVDYSTKETTFRLRIISDKKMRMADVVSNTKVEAIKKLSEAGYTYAP